MNKDLRSWDQGAERYLEVATAEDAYKQLRDDPTFITMLGNVSGKSVLDIGCGDGALCVKLRQSGALTTGVDGSPKMTGIAAAGDPDGNYVTADVMHALPFDAESFDIVTAKMMLINLSSVRDAAANIYPVLRKDGIFAVNVVHPFRPLLKSMANQQGRYDKDINYFKESRGSIEFGGKDYAFYYRPLSQYINEILSAGFTLLMMNEIGVDAEFAEAHPEHIHKVDQPVSLHMLFKK